MILIDNIEISMYSHIRAHSFTKKFKPLFICYFVSFVLQCVFLGEECEYLLDPQCCTRYCKQIEGAECGLGKISLGLIIITCSGVVRKLFIPQL